MAEKSKQNRTMKLYEFINPSDPITFYAPDNDIAETVTIVVGGGRAGLKATDGSDVPNTMYFLGVSDTARDKITKTMDTRIDEFFEAAKTFAVCEASLREEYDELTKDSTDTERIQKWDDKHRSSMTNWCDYARGLKLKEKAGM